MKKDKIEFKYRGHLVTYNEGTDMWETVRPGKEHYKYPHQEKSLATLKRNIDRIYRKPLVAFYVWVHPETDSYREGNKQFIRGKVTQVGVDDLFYIDLDKGGKQRSNGYHMFVDTPKNVVRMEKIMKLYASIDADHKEKNNLEFALERVDAEKVRDQVLGKGK